MKIKMKMKMGDGVIRMKIKIKIKIKMKEAGGYRLKVGPDFRAGRVEMPVFSLELTRRVWGIN